MAQPSTISASFRRHSAALCAAALLALGFLFFINPATAGWMPPCPLHALTGLACPGCGSLRAIHSLLHLNGMQALAYNPLTCLCLPFLGIWWLWHARRAATGRAPGIPFIRPALLWSIVAMIGFFGIYRNIMPTMPIPTPDVPQSAVTANLADERTMRQFFQGTGMGRFVVPRFSPTCRGRACSILLGTMIRARNPIGRNLLRLYNGYGCSGGSVEPHDPEFLFY